MGRVVSCRECDTEVELPDELKPGKVYRCPDCREPLPLPKAAKSRPADDEVPERKRRRDEDEEEDERPRKRPKSRDTEDADDEAPPRRKKRARREEPESKPFWQSKQGKILSGVLLLGLGVVALGLTIAFDSRRPIRGYVGGGACILFGLIGIISGLASSDDDDSE